MLLPTSHFLDPSDIVLVPNQGSHPSQLTPDSLPTCIGMRIESASQVLPEMTQIQFYCNLHGSGRACQQLPDKADQIDAAAASAAACHFTTCSGMVLVVIAAIHSSAAHLDERRSCHLLGTGHKPVAYKYSRHKYSANECAKMPRAGTLSVQVVWWRCIARLEEGFVI